MNFDPWTLGFQLLNFTVLLLVLFRVLFKPLRETMARRAAQVQAALDAAEKARTEAEQLRASLSQEQVRVARERERMLGALQAEIGEQRQRRLAAVQAETGALLERGRAVLESDRRKADEELREKARLAVGAYAAALLADVADPELHKALLRRFPEAFAAALAAAGGGTSPPGEPVATQVESAFALTEEETAGLRAVLGRSIPVAALTAVTEPGLLAGVRLRAADRLFDFSLRGQLDTLTEKLKALA